ncbi:MULTISPECIES: type V toxin-antitoxin system endoribonuclease antitoxin GhoS [Enterobacter]|uniref:type V toxin-antitoxin system endoribonuclease antitoxin GhoS n=1 Tax=Enterobacter TaxID=547 RepID=UPI00077BDA08|nr:type V toxin-antitoxin system endoribonuclease antitoxin GhoS [Enterobacter pseudoroggenkampii]WJW87052.1 type V toxin-antitoxin system endoribonuclease antitoxin GhoS [Enterobacter pseudoroggenkampii]
MTSYTVRVELHGAESDEYEKLHAEMAKEGFDKIIMLDGIYYELPTAEYSLVDSSLTTLEVTEKAFKAAKKVQPQPVPSILTTATETPRMAFGLKPV